MTDSKLCKLFSSSYLDRSTAPGFQKRLIFELYVVTGFRKKELAELERWQVRPLMNAIPRRISIRKRLGSSVGTATNARGGKKFAGEVPTEVSIFKTKDGEKGIYFFDDLLDYIALRDSITLSGEQDKLFLLAVNHSDLPKEEFFKMQVVGTGTIYSRITKVCHSLGLKGLGGPDGIMPHSFRAINITKLLEGEHQGVDICKRTGHANPKGLDKYTSGSGELGRNTQKCIIKMDTSGPCNG